MSALSFSYSSNSRWHVKLQMSVLLASNSSCSISQKSASMSRVLRHDARSVYGAAIRPPTPGRHAPRGRVHAVVRERVQQRQQPLGHLLDAALAQRARARQQPPPDHRVCATSRIPPHVYPVRQPGPPSTQPSLRKAHRRPPSRKSPGAIVVYATGGGRGLLYPRNVFVSLSAASVVNTYVERATRGARLTFWACGSAWRR